MVRKKANRPFGLIFKYLREFSKFWFEYISVFIGTTLAITFVIIPLLESISGLIMRLSGIPYVSYNNLGNLIQNHFLGVLGLLIILFLLIFLVYVQFIVQFKGIRLIQSRSLTLKNLFKEVVSSAKKVKIQQLGFFLFYFLLIIPFGRYVFSTPLLSKIKIPVFTLEFFLKSWQNMLILVLFYAITFWISTHLILTLPLMILKGQPLKLAIKESLKRTKGVRKFFRLSVYFGLIGLFSIIMQGLLFMGGYFAQDYLDKTSFALIGAVSILDLIWLGSLIISTLSLMMLFSYLINEAQMESFEVPKIAPKGRMKYKVIFSSLTILLFALVSWTYVEKFMDTVPLTISHRGVDEENGVQNTIPALEATAKAKPDYVEIDIQETKDHQFVVFHDPTLKDLAGIDSPPQKLTLAELKNTVVSENGKKALIPSFDDYLSAAEKINQKLLVEIKVSPLDSPKMVENFSKRYGARLLKDKAMIHSLDYNALLIEQKINPKIKVSFILPFNLLFPQTKMSAYTMEATTLTSSFVDKAQAKHQMVFAWTVNDETDMREQMFNGVNGIITDNLDDLKGVIAEDDESPSYAQRILRMTSLMEIE
ncbi:Membrane domain of membrane-anchored glycerophosphoryl diester phosphodiesterase [Lactococcus cremoris subsp. cremoris SK11]|uniref:Membrane domain of membrane-anchored glycerophosphoryl diester phosphodiesterase n=2 Tax=Lactococcus lactis subsp. cremoris TaxID=1359 RepID=Q02WD7_LACLS|nr:glycerophosphodiester phosphodiesterase [Lactococcus cremoris]ABJ73735.1 Membrane domain of membrane-anchored glycerophosphoryl diester phosphodiesterase [Lactococcus cremoris subsp. cremoris SK11]ARE24443.1 glycerophosphodiester phosphodiesterase [Lactococcus cremoris]KZK50156.1 Glycerophosphoryl diester phosphodiesterase [Lactococcus cremoris]KZK55110.1 Glycerophosphoryl diester phosphodiesterase [Lactococcus cremoris]MCT4408175.1 glycerophosphodiester phosphodiesterase [Lactococcus cremo